MPTYKMARARNSRGRFTRRSSRSSTRTRNSRGRFTKSARKATRRSTRRNRK